MYLSSISIHNDFKVSKMSTLNKMDSRAKTAFLNEKRIKTLQKGSLGLANGLSDEENLDILFECNSLPCLKKCI